MHANHEDEYDEHRQYKLTGGKPGHDNLEWRHHVCRNRHVRQEQLRGQQTGRDPAKYGRAKQEDLLEQQQRAHLPR